MSDFLPGIFPHKIPGAVHDVGEVAFGGPAQELIGFCGIGDEGWWIAGTAWADFAADGLAGRGFGGLDYFQDGIAFARAEVDGKGIAFLFEMLKGADVGVGKVVDVDVVAEAGAVGRGIVRAEDLQLKIAGQRGLESERDEVRFRIVEFTDLAGLVGSGGIEVAQAGDMQSVGSAVGFEGIFEGELGGAVGIDGLAGIVFGDGDFDRNAVDGAGGAEDEVTDTGVDGGVEEGERVGHIVAEILARVGDGLSDIAVGGEVHDGIDTREHMMKFALVADVALDELEAFGELAEAGGKIVVDDDVIAGFAQGAGGMTADVTCASDNENGHGEPRGKWDERLVYGVEWERGQRRRRL